MRHGFLVADRISCFKLTAKQTKVGIALLLFVFNGIVLAYNADANAGIHVKVKNILASNQSDQVDAQCRSFIKELQSVFRYSSYKCLNECEMTLAMGSTGKTALPGNRMMHITPMEKNGNRLKLRLEIFKNNQPIFQTVVQLLNAGTLTVGGPQHENGVLLFNISGFF